MASKPLDVVCEGDVCRRVAPDEKAAAPSENSSLKLLGTTLKGQGGIDVPVSSITGPGKVIGLYFSAHWCPPCRHFTPHLASIYKRFKESHPNSADWEVVFVSSDRDEKAFSEYFAEMPWLALPYSDREAKAALSQKFKVRGIPTLIILDGATGEVITPNGREAVGADETGAGFPWRPKTFQQILSGCPLLPAPGSSVGIDDALAELKGKHTLLYFSASWCGPCQRFTPKLMESFAKLKAEGKAVQVLYVPHDRDAVSFKEYHAKMTWPALDLTTQKERIKELTSAFDIEGFPTLVVLDEHHKVVTADGTAAVLQDPQGRRFPWAPQPLDRLGPLTASRINEAKVLLLALDEEDEAKAEALAEGVAGEVARSTRAAPGGEEWAFLWGPRGDEMTTNVLEFTEVASKADPKGHLLLLIDVPGAQTTWDLTTQYGLSAEGLARVVADARAGALPKGHKLGSGGEGEDEEEEDE